MILRITKKHFPKALPAPKPFWIPITPSPEKIYDILLKYRYKKSRNPLALQNLGLLMNFITSFLIDQNTLSRPIIQFFFFYIKFGMFSEYGHMSSGLKNSMFLNP